ncbi:MAG: type II toxin-antitoxin system VapC family toxin [Polyangiaceae bacterium]|nr:type II toxin-antitoxin system VapC family toxin [Polyangiaceae bacterium]
MIVLDTHVWFWLVASPDRLSDASVTAIDSADELFLSPISCWEIAMLVHKGRLEINQPTEQWLESAMQSTGMALLPIGPTIAALAARLPLHGDPADRLIVATAITFGAQLVTKDHSIRSSGLVTTVW